MVKRIDYLPRPDQLPAEEVIERRALETSRFPGLWLSSHKVRGVHYVIEDIHYNEETGKWTYEFLDPEGEWKVYSVTEDAVRKRIPEPLVDHEIFFQRGELA